MNEYVIEEAGTIADVLASSAVAPPARAGTGAALALRDAMARFAAPSDHAERRRAVEAAVRAVDVAAASEHARLLTSRALDGGDADAIALASLVPVGAVAMALGLVAPNAEATTWALHRDVERVVDVIGRGAPTSRAADAAAGRLLACAADHACGAVPVVSLLYQSYDATAALITTTLDSHARDADRAAAVPRTYRTVLESCAFDDRDLAAGDELALEIGSAGLEFGSGPHACPGQTIARAIADAVVCTVGTAGYHVNLASIARDPDGRPIRMRLRGRSRTRERPRARPESF